MPGAQLGDASHDLLVPCLRDSGFPVKACDEALSESGPFLGRKQKSSGSVPKNHPYPGTAPPGRSSCFPGASA